MFTSRRRSRTLPLLTIVACWLASFATAHERPLTLSDRIAAQEAIERVYSSHQIGATGTRAQALPREVLERKVRTYLEQSAALEHRWHTPITAEMLRAELERIARDTRFPERLLEVYHALGDDPVLVQETFARASLADRLARGFHAFDERIHAAARAEAEALRKSLRSGELSAYQSHPRRTVVEYVSDDRPLADRAGDRLAEPGRIAVSPEQLEAIRAAVPRRLGEVTGPTNERDGFTLTVLLAEAPAEIRIATYRIPKQTWSEFRNAEEASLDLAALPTVALSIRLPRTSSARANASAAATAGIAPGAPGRSLPSAADFCIPNDTWDNGSLATGMIAASGASAVWTGMHMIVWGGRQLDHLGSGSLYDPLTDSWRPTATLGAPAPREGHTAVWTGVEMIVWGGRGVTPYQDGGRYDPAMDSWTPLSTVGAPTGRSMHAAVWTGSEMLVWGGSDPYYFPTLYFDDGGRYDPDSDTWAAMAGGGAPSARDSHSAVWSGSELLIWGGWDGANVLGDGGRYDPVANTWVALPAGGAPSARAWHTAVWAGSVMVIWGGWGDPNALRSGAEYNPATNTWSATPIGGAPSARSGHQAVWTGTEMLVWGGSDDNGDLDTGGGYDPVTNDWRPLSGLNAPIARSGNVAVWTGHLMLLWGGIDAEGHSLFTGGRYDPSSDTWTPTSTGGSQPAQWGQTAVWTGTVMLTFGGDQDYLTATSGRYDPLTDSWTALSTLNAPSARSAHAAVWTGSRMLIWGGIGAGATATGSQYDPVADAWSDTTTAGAPSARWSFASVWTGSELLVWGGDSEAGVESDGARYDPGADSWTPLGSDGAPSPRSSPLTESCAATGRRRIPGESTSPRSSPLTVWSGTEMIVWGGFYGPGGIAPGDGARYDPVTDAWIPMATTGAPAGRAGATAVWDGIRMLIWGGSISGTPLGNGTRYNPATNAWSAIAASGAPGPRSGHSGVWTGSRMIIWGGLGPANQPLRSGGRYDPVANTWLPTSTPDAPEGRYKHSTVWTGDFMIVWGGEALPLTLNTGGRYALGQYVDADLDGVAICADDCDDADPARFPGNAEICDGIDNDCNLLVDDGGDPDGDGVIGPCDNCSSDSNRGQEDGDADGAGDPCDCAPLDFGAFRVPFEVSGLGVAADVVTLYWNSAAPTAGAATAHDLLSGVVEQLPVGGGAAESCVHVGISESSIVDSTLPTSRHVRWYLVRGSNLCGVGTFGHRSSGAERISGACP